MPKAKKIKFTLKTFVFLVFSNAAAAEIVDSIVATVGLGAEKIVLTASEVKQPALFAKMQPVELQAHIDNRLQLIEAKNFKIGTHTLDPSSATVNAQLERIKAGLEIPGADDAKTEAKLQEMKLSLAELKEQIVNYYMVSQLWQFSFPDHATVPLSAIEEYYKNNPESIPAQAHLMVAEIEASALNALIKKHKGLLLGSIDKEALAKELSFFDLGMLNIDQLDETNKPLVVDAHDGDICLPTISNSQLEKNEKLQVLKVVKKVASRNKTLEERKVEIIQTIQLEESEKRYKNYLEELQKKAFVRIFATS
jgi:hypothetical protein